MPCPSSTSSTCTTTASTHWRASVRRRLKSPVSFPRLILWNGPPLHTEHLSALRILNLAGNALTGLSDLSALSSLTELNLRRNAITSLLPTPHAPVHADGPAAFLPLTVQRFFLSYNQLVRTRNVGSL